MISSIHDQYLLLTMQTNQVDYFRVKIIALSYLSGFLYGL